MRRTLLASAILALVSSGSAMAAGLSPGQYDIGGIQQICLKSDGTWYGTGFNFNGHWQNSPGGDDRAAIWGNYQAFGPYYGYSNDTITVEKQVADWYDWNDDNSYSAYLPAQSFIKVKKHCDAPALAISGRRRAATQ